MALSRPGFFFQVALATWRAESCTCVYLAFLCAYNTCMNTKATSNTNLVAYATTKTPFLGRRTIQNLGFVCYNHGNNVSHTVCSFARFDVLFLFFLIVVFGRNDAV